MMVTVAVFALHEFVQLFGKLEGSCIIVILMENVCVALKGLFGAQRLLCEAQTIFGGKLERVSEHPQLLLQSGLITEKTVVLASTCYFLLLLIFPTFIVLLRL